MMQSKGFSPGPDEQPRTVLHASRDERDVDDAATLFSRLGCSNAQQGIGLLARIYPVAQLLPRHRYIVQVVAERAAGRYTGEDSAPQGAP